MRDNRNYSEWVGHFNISKQRIVNRLGLMFNRHWCENGLHQVPAYKQAFYRNIMGRICKH